MINKILLLYFQNHQEPSSSATASKVIDKIPLEEEEADEFEDEKQFEADYEEDFSSRPWYFTNGERCPKTARINKKTKKRLAKLTPYEDTRGDRITNQLMFVPPNYEEIKNAGTLKTILVYNGLGPWNVKQGKLASEFN